MKFSDYVNDCVHLLYYKCHKTNPDRGESYIDSTKWIKHEKVSINPIDRNNNKCLQYTVTITLNDANIGGHTKRITKYNWAGINYLSEKDDGKKIKKNNLMMCLNVLYAKTEKIYPVYV